MSYYKSISIDGVIAKIIRDTRIQDSSYVSDFYEWIPEAMTLMRTQQELVSRCMPIKVNFHVGRLPCGLVHIDAVEYKGKRLRWHNGVRMATSASTQTDGVYESVITFTQAMSDPTTKVVDSKLVPPSDFHSHHGYKLELDTIKTTFADGEVIVYYKTTAVDDRGLPLIVDHGDYKEAIYWYVRMKLIQSGYEDPMYRNDDRMAFQRWELHAARAISDITYPSVDEKEAQLAMHVRFIPPTDYYESFFNTKLSEGPLGL